MQLALSGGVGAEARRSDARERILQAGFWLPPTLRPNAEVRQLYPAVPARRAPTSNP